MSDQEDEGWDWILYRNRPEWNDVSPVTQDEGSNAVVRIAYAEKFQDAFDYFRAILLSDEHSERAFELTKDCAQLNPANYTVWHFRRILLNALEKDLEQELHYIQGVIEDNPKNYQVWHHRQVIVERLEDPTHEKRLTNIVLAMDAKNYHAWQHRQWVVDKFGLWEGELEFTNTLLDEDIRNNSAWNHRYLVISRPTTTAEELDEEIKLTLTRIKEVPGNESAWNYLRGILEYGNQPMDYDPVWKCCTELYDSENRSAHLLAFMVEALEHKKQTQDAIQMCKELSEKHDTVRKEYWNFMARTITTQSSSA